LLYSDRGRRTGTWKWFWLRSDSRYDSLPWISSSAFRTNTTLVLGLQSITPAYRPLGDHRLESLQKRKDDVEDPLGRPVEVQRASPLKAGG
jgi:hypothetical protein